MNCLCHVASVIVSVCFGVGSGVGQTYLVMKDLEIASHHGGGGGVVTKGLEIPPEPGRSSHAGRSRKVLEFPGPCKMHSAIPMCPPEYM